MTLTLSETRFNQRCAVLLISVSPKTVTSISAPEHSENALLQGQLFDGLQRGLGFPKVKTGSLSKLLIDSKGYERDTQSDACVRKAKPDIKTSEGVATLTNLVCFP
jgi:hypothetical protein